MYSVFVFFFFKYSNAHSEFFFWWVIDYLLETLLKSILPKSGYGIQPNRFGHIISIGRLDVVNSRPSCVPGARDSLGQLCTPVLAFTLHHNSEIIFFKYCCVKIWAEYSSQELCVNAFSHERIISTLGVNALKLS